MFERFTDRARRVVVLARKEATLLNHDYIGPEHILLGLIREGEGVAPKALVSLGIDMQALQQQVEGAIGRGTQTPSGHIPFTPQAKHVLEMSLREALQLGHNYIGTEHLLLGLIRENDDVAARILVETGADASAIKRQVILLLHGHSGNPSRQTIASSLTGRNRRIDEIRQGIEAIMIRLTAIEEALDIVAPSPPGSGPGYTARMDELRREKEAAFEAGDFKQAAALRDQEKELIRQRDAAEAEWLAEARRRRERERGAPGGAGVADGVDEGAEVDEGAGVGEGEGDAAEVERLRREVERLQAVLREHGIAHDHEE